MTAVACEETEEKEDEVPDMNEEENVEDEEAGCGLARTTSRRHDGVAVK